MRVSSSFIGTFGPVLWLTFELLPFPVLLKPAYQRLIIGKIKGQEKKIFPRCVHPLPFLPLARIAV
jgi:hypothetical protein